MMREHPCDWRSHWVHRPSPVNWNFFSLWVSKNDQTLFSGVACRVVCLFVLYAYSQWLYLKGYVCFFSFCVKSALITWELDEHHEVVEVQDGHQHQRNFSHYLLGLPALLNKELKKQFPDTSAVPPCYKWGGRLLHMDHVSLPVQARHADVSPKPGSCQCSWSKWRDAKKAQGSMCWAGRIPSCAVSNCSFLPDLSSVAILIPVGFR